MKTSHKYLAEFIGTFSLTLIVGLSLANALPLSTPVLAALTLGLFVYTIGPISGAHLNPAVTLGLWSIKKIHLKEALGYMVSQILGALAAMLAAQQVFDILMSQPARNTLVTGIAEGLGAFFLVFGIGAVVYGKVKDTASGLVIGGSLLLGIHMAAGFSNGVLNPAVAIGIGSVSAMYLLAPVVGAVAAAWVVRYLNH